jgi:hypothetical protein
MHGAFLSPPWATRSWPAVAAAGLDEEKEEERLHMRTSLREVAREDPASLRPMAQARRR